MAQMTALEIKSQENLFVGPRPEVVGDGIFNVYNSSKLFVIQPPPYSQSLLDLARFCPQVCHMRT